MLGTLFMPPQPLQLWHALRHGGSAAHDQRTAPADCCRPVPPAGIARRLQTTHAETLHATVYRPEAGDVSECHSTRPAGCTCQQEGAELTHHNSRSACVQGAADGGAAAAAAGGVTCAVAGSSASPGSARAGRLAHLLCFLRMAGAVTLPRPRLDSPAAGLVAGRPPARDPGGSPQGGFQRGTCLPARMACGVAAGAAAGRSEE